MLLRGRGTPKGVAMRARLDPAKVKARRLLMNMTQADLTNRADISAGTLSRLEQGLAGSTQLLVARSIAAALATSVDALSISREGEPGEHDKE